MSPTTYFAMLALASQAFAVPHAGHHGHAAHQRAHRRDAPAAYSIPAAMPYPISNGTSTRSSELSPQSPTLIPTGPSSSSSNANAVPTAYGSSSSKADAITASSQSSAAIALPSSPGSSSQDITTTKTIRKTSTTTLYTTLYLSSTSAAQQHPASSSAGTNSASPYKEGKNVAANTAGSNAPAVTGADQCGAVTVTATEKVTQYITVPFSSTGVAPAVKSSSAPSSSSVVKVESSSRSANSTHYAPTAYSSHSTPRLSSKSSEAGALPGTSSSAPAYVIPHSSVEAAAVTTSASSAPAYTSPSLSSASEAAPSTTSKSSATTAVIIPTTYENKGLTDAIATTSSSSTSAPASQSSVASSSGGKRGLAYNDASLTECFTGGSEITWGYNWGSSADGLPSGFSFIPTLWGTRSDFTSVWEKNAKSAISSGSHTLFSFNEPDLPAQANLSPQAAAEAYKTYMQPLGGSAKLCAPSVTNSGTDGQGLSWLSDFLEACSDCQIDCINIHWYDSAENTAYFKSHIDDATKIANGKPIYVSEFGATGSDEQISSFLEDVMPYMDSNSAVAGYAYFMVQSGNLVTGNEPSDYGKVYKSYT